MSIPAMALMFAGGTYVGNQPDGPPTNVTQFLYDGTKVGYTWINGDRDAGIEYSYDGGSTVQGTLAPKTTSRNTAITLTVWNDAGNTFAVRHYDGALRSAWAAESV